MLQYLATTYLGNQYRYSGRMRQPDLTKEHSRIINASSYIFYTLFFNINYFPFTQLRKTSFILHKPHIYGSDTVRIRRQQLKQYNSLYIIQLLLNFLFFLFLLYFYIIYTIFNKTTENIYAMYSWSKDKHFSQKKKHDATKH